MFLKRPKKIKSFQSGCLKYRLMKTAAVSLNTTVRQTTEMSQQKNDRNVSNVRDVSAKK